MHVPSSSIFPCVPFCASYSCTLPMLPAKSKVEGFPVADPPFSFPPSLEVLPKHILCARISAGTSRSCPCWSPWPRASRGALSHWCIRRLHRGNRISRRCRGHFRIPSHPKSACPCLCLEVVERDDKPTQISHCLCIGLELVRELVGVGVSACAGVCTCADP